jgi:hypothetical protein
VISHQEVNIQAYTDAFLVPLQEAEKMAAIVVIAKDPLPIVSAVQDLITCFFRPLLPARGAWHRLARVCASKWSLQDHGHFTHNSQIADSLRTVSPLISSSPAARSGQLEYLACRKS